MSVPLVLITVTLMLSVPTPLVLVPVSVMMATVEIMDSPVWLSKSHGLQWAQLTADINAGCTNTVPACVT